MPQNDVVFRGRVKYLPLFRDHAWPGPGCGGEDWLGCYPERQMFMVRFTRVYDEVAPR
jgi:hypothetical protein